jgi:hypothetical protein
MEGFGRLYNQWDDGRQPVRRRRWLLRYPPTSSQRARILADVFSAESSALLLKAMGTKDKGAALNSPPLGKGGQGGSQNLHPKAVKLGHSRDQGGRFSAVGGYVALDPPNPPLAKGGRKSEHLRHDFCPAWVAGEARPMG